MESIASNINSVRSKIPSDVCLVAVSKFKPVPLLQEAYDAGQRDFGENYVQEFVEKVGQLPQDINWHFIGHLQTNKVKQVLPAVYMIHSVDSVRLLNEINKQALKLNKVVNVLLQIFIAQESSKEGMDKDELDNLLKSIESYEHIKVCGLMGMASFTDNKEILTREFNYLKGIYDECGKLSLKNCDFKILSMGMSGDFEQAIAHGSNMIRVGTAIFGKR